MTFFAGSDVDAEARFKRFFSLDPFPEIPPALLNSSDIRSYVGATGMIHPFADAEENFKTASYEVSLLGKCVYWDSEGNKIIQHVQRGEEFLLRQNSIAFVTLEPMFRLPQYIALRFNLKITHVYRGILLGTGPLVDPGYRNRLSIPLHNLTTNDYIFRGGEGLIWMEFTKLHHSSFGDPQPGSEAPEKWTGQIAEFPVVKNQLSDVEDYIRKGEPHRSVRSSIPKVFHDAEKAAKEASDAIARFEKFALLGLAIAIIFGFFPIVSLVHDVNNTSVSAKEQLDAANRQRDKDQSAVSQIRADLDRLKAELDSAKARIDSMTTNSVGKSNETKRGSSPPR